MRGDGLRGMLRDAKKSGDLDARDLSKKKKEGSGRTRNLSDQSMRSYLERLEKRGGLLRVDKEVDPATNLAAIEWKTYNQHGKGTLFTNIKGHPGWQACSQVLSDRSMWSLALNLMEDELLEGVGRRLRTRIDPVVGESSGAPCKEVVKRGDDASLLDIPVVTQSEKDGGPVIPAGMAIIKDPETGIRNMSIHRMQVFDARTAGFIMLPRQARRIYEKYVAKGQNMPVAIAIGAHPAIIFGSAFTTTFGVDELSVAGGLLGDPVRLVKAETVDIEVPADAEIILEGEILADEMHPEGPYGEVPGTYCDAGESEVFRVHAITHRRDPIYYALHCGAPDSDTQAITGLGIEIATWEHLAKIEGGLDILDVRCLPAGGMMLMVVKMRPRVEGQAKTALMGALSGPYLHPKLAIAVDDDIDASDLRQVMWSMTTRVHAERDVTMIHNTRTFALDKVSPIADGGNPFERVGTKWLIDATKPATSHPEERARFARAMPKNFDKVKLEDFLPAEMFG